MSIEQDLMSLSHAELVALVQQLRRQLAERDQEIARLRRHSQDAPSAPQEVAASQDLSPSNEEASRPGSREDLLALLEKIYPERKEP